jgi:hypothetical protein
MASISVRKEEFQMSNLSGQGFNFGLQTNKAANWCAFGFFDVADIEKVV